MPFDDPVPTHTLGSTQRRVGTDQISWTWCSGYDHRRIQGIEIHILYIYIQGFLYASIALGCAHGHIYNRRFDVVQTIFLHVHVNEASFSY